MKKLAYFLIITSLSFTACDEIDDPIPAEAGTSFSLNGDVEFIIDNDLGLADTNALKAFLTNNVWDTVVSSDNSARRNVVLEEFTGHECRQCPAGTREITRLQGKDKFGKQLIAIGIHSGNFAFPRSSGTKFRTNFIVAGGHGKAYEDKFNLLGYPAGIVSRIGGNVVGLNQWEADINAIKNDVPSSSLKITNYYSAVLNVVRSEMEISWNETLTDSIKLQVQLIEDSIIDWQTDGNTDIENYVHRHVLRKVVNTTFGKKLNPAINGNTQKIQYIYKIDPAWKPKDIEVVSFVFKNTTNDLDILQANEAHIQ